jgi:hypothetical protein
MRAKRTALAIDADRRMSEFPNQLPGGLGTAAAESEPDPMVEADELALSKIRSMCAVAMASAEGMAQVIHADLTRIDRLRFASAKRMSLELARTIAEVSYRDAALQHIIALCMAANDTEVSRILVQGIQSEPVRENLFRAYPILFR